MVAAVILAAVTRASDRFEIVEPAFAKASSFAEATARQDAGASVQRPTPNAQRSTLNA